MPSLTDWKVPAAIQPRPRDYDFDVAHVLSAIVGIHSTIPGDAFSASTLGVERAGNGVLIDRNLVLTIGYLITEAETVWIHLGDGRVVQGHAAGIDQETGFGLVQALGEIELDPLRLGDSDTIAAGERVIVGGVGGLTRSVAARVAAINEFAGYWEYALDEAIFTLPAHPNWGGAGLISSAGDLVGIGSLQIERTLDGKDDYLNMIVPINLLKPRLSDLLSFGRVNKPARPWLGLFAAEVDNNVVIAGVSPKGPAARADLREGDIVVAIGGEKVTSLIGFYRKYWALGPAGVQVPLTLYREGRHLSVNLTSADRNNFMKAPRLH